jgi:hypothetical protein
VSRYTLLIVYSISFITTHLGNARVTGTSWYAQHYLARAPNLEKKVQVGQGG